VFRHRLRWFLVSAANIRRELASSPACSGGCQPVGFLALLDSHSMSGQANASTKPFFGEWSIRGFFNTIRPIASAKVGLGLRARSRLFRQKRKCPVCAPARATTKS
jgi:hypothetical protein